jgi:hypothetical protein
LTNSKKIRKKTNPAVREEIIPVSVYNILTSIYNLEKIFIDDE